jgi:Family of unknown function (DUF6166)
MRVLPVMYQGRRSSGLVSVQFQQVEGEAWFDLDPRFDLVNHSPDGFEWGYGGSGPSQLALAICASRLDDADALRIYQRFKTRCVAQIPQNSPSWTSRGVTVDLLIQTILAEDLAHALPEEVAS